MKTLLLTNRQARELVEVLGGVAYVIKKSPGVEVTIRDLDNEKERK